jgi:epoxyqueuosine reductase
MLALLFQQPHMNRLESQIKSWAAELGFDDCRITRAHTARHSNDFLCWIRDGNHGEMTWLERTPERRCDPKNVLPECRSVICLATHYFPGPWPQSGTATGGFRIARYAWNDDYHPLIERRLRAFDIQLQTLGGHQKSYVDTGPILERDAATSAGLGWNGKSTMQIHRQLGTWFFLSEILTTLELVPDAPSVGHCGKCTRCIHACPTHALTAPHRLDARRCISYLTIEHPGPIPLEFREAIGDRIYGCDACLETCPWNRFAVQSRDLAFHARPEILALRLRDFLDLDDAAFRSLFAGSPIKRLKRPRFLRNVCVALGNTGNEADLPALHRAEQDPHPLIAEHAAWATSKVHAKKSNTP